MGDITAPVVVLIANRSVIFTLNQYNITLGPDAYTAHGHAVVARTEAKLLILCAIPGGRVLAQHGVFTMERNRRSRWSGIRALGPWTSMHLALTHRVLSS